ncbi:hypothetical protein EDD86DRAFT_190821 [Gorgonomyces haynaldii]|nr:hypothetical protein EDD86DRAFT_190821 [Gorgonomyces haynaldii]
MSNGSRFLNVYSSSGLDVLTVMAAVVNRPNPIINVGPIDLSCAFSISDSRQYDHPLTYVSPGFEEMTGYSSLECIGRNCRFLQSPQGHVVKGSKRELVDNDSIYQLKKAVESYSEIQLGLVNFHKSGRPFLNLITIIPISLEPGIITHFVAFQVDLISRSQRLVNPVEFGLRTANLPQIPALPTENRIAFTAPTEDFPHTYEQRKEEREIPFTYKSLVECSPDMTVILSSRGVVLYITNACKSLVGWEPKQLIGEQVTKFVHSGDAISLLRSLKGTAVKEHILRKIRVKMSNGALNWVEVSGHKYQMNTRKQTKCYILSVRLREEGALDISLLNAAVDAEAVIIKVARHGMICEVFGTTATPFLVFAKGSTILDKLERIKRTELLNVLSRPIDSSDNMFHMTALFYEEETEQFCYMVIKRFTAEHSYIAVSLSPLHQMPETGNIFSSISPSQPSATQHELNALKQENDKLRLAIDEKSNS